MDKLVVESSNFLGPANTWLLLLTGCLADCKVASPKGVFCLLQIATIRFVRWLLFFWQVMCQGGCHGTANSEFCTDVF